MDIQDFAPAGGGSLRGRPVIHAGQQVGTFTDTQTTHPDEIWNDAIGGEREHDQPKGSRPRQDRRKAEHMERLPHEEAASQIRAALRPGS